MVEKITHAEFLEKAKVFFEGEVPFDENEIKELLEKTNEMIEKHSERNTMTAAQKENLELEEEILVASLMMLFMSL